MDTVRNFRSAFHGFNREDVVRYIEYLNAQHSTDVNQLKSEIQSLQEELNQLRCEPSSDALKEAAARCADLEQERDRLADALKQEQEKQSVPSGPSPDASAVSADRQELEAYRRAERAERLAEERASRIYQQANGVLAEATVQVDEAASQLDGAAAQVSSEINRLSQQIADQLAHLQDEIASSKKFLQDAASALYTIKPESGEQ